MNQEIQLTCVRERFYRRERRSVPLAREFVRQALAELGMGAGERAEEVLLCVSELVTNALVHGVPPGRGFRLQLWVTGDGALRVEVHDSGEGRPRAGAVPAGAEEEAGRGLMLVEALADKWGVGERAPGKIVWCEFEV
ncbi:ATP-binding protein [Streptomyces sp. NPDC003077]|uniref:ATP-binding protein n=1 Tax=Streptomyces sp. NPDC003077 TaxID=3154443 RepID=UPI0033ACEF6E